MVSRYELFQFGVLLLKQPRYLGVLDLAAQKAGWGKPLPKGVGRGIAVHFAFGSYSAHVAEVSVTEGKVRVHRMVCAIDCGQYVNPGIIAAQAEGGKLLCGGKVLPQPGNFVEPAIIRASVGMAVVRTETFAPILYVIAYDTLDEAVTVQNSVPYGLSSAVFTDRLQVAERFLSAEGSDCGIANVNLGTSGAEIGGAFGGEKDTGGGREAGSDSWKAYMRRQTNTINWSSQLPLAQGIRFNV